MFGMMPYRKRSLAERDDFFSPFIRNFFNDDFFSMMDNIHESFKVDLKETDDNYMVEADLPGVNKDAIDIEYFDNQLTISAKRDEAIEDKRENYVRRERHYGKFTRSFYLDNVDENRIDASFNDGVLRIILPKLNKGNGKKRRINIQ